MEASLSLSLIKYVSSYFERTYDRYRSVRRKILFNFWIHIQDYFGLRPTFDGLPFCFRKYRTASISSSSFLFSPSLFDCWFGLDDDEEPGPEPASAMTASFFCCLLPQFPIATIIPTKIIMRHPASFTISLALWGLYPLLHAHTIVQPQPLQPPPFSLSAHSFATS